MLRRCFGGYDLEQIDVAPTIAEILGIPFHVEGKPLKEILEYGKSCRNLILIIIDSFGYLSYLKSRRFFRNISKMGHDGRLYRCKSNADKTTPAIASILCGRKPKTHKIYRTGDVYGSHIKSILEKASEQDIKSAVVMEEEGALTFDGLIDIIKPMKDRKDMIEFDRITKEATIDVIREDYQFIVSHLRVIDKLGYTLKAIKCIDDKVLEIFKACKIGSLIMLCGDHPPHGSKECSVPLIVDKVI
ncbi:MAG: hypothetical protein L6N95_04765 [Candidatus Methylarchaceae archaeon HK01B]|nr:hypothetical protein [Candidatus Methylarchaceae archaeon HK01M]MCP8311655.1 hypothetical protein [Candidatus Methylarchaceae archaeon HK02M1]MCP8319122.1 hypothetical protein [Candidatus Methylarchaceae archaeon HK01B]